MKRCVDCETDIRHRGNRTKRCEQCAAQRRREKKRTPEYKERRRKRDRKRYHNDSEFRERERKRRQTPKCKEQLRKRRQTPKFKEWRRQWQKTSEYKEKRRKWQKTPEYKERRRKQEQTPEYKERNRERQSKRRQLLGGNGYRRAWPELLLRDGPVCGICGEDLDPIRDEFQVDHIVPVAHGGTNDLSNLQLAHPSCNNAKRDKWDGTQTNEPPVQLGLFS